YLRPHARSRLPGDAYQLVWRHERALQRLRAENPTLFPVFGLCWPRLQFPLHGGYAGLRSALRQCGMSKSGWQQLARSGYCAVRALRVTPWFMADPVAVLVAYFNLLAACQRVGLPPAALARALIESEALLRLRAGHATIVTMIVRAAWDFCGDLDRAGLALFVEHEFLPVLNAWLLEHWEKPIPAGMRWPWFRRQLAAFRKYTAAAGLLTKRWPCALPAFRHGAWIAMPLMSGEALFEEGIAMRHCVGLRSYILACADGSGRLFSIRDARCGRRVATLYLKCDDEGNWVRKEMTGFANAVVSSELVAFGDRLRDTYQLAVPAVSQNDLSESEGDMPRGIGDGDIRICRRA
ncbi:MAG: hypothetical protein ACREP1_02180, partial [Rhodanobacteraceae bacterium]